MTWIIIGASAGVGRALATALAERGEALLLVASDKRDLSPLAADLEIAWGGHVRALEADATDPSRLAEAVSEAVADKEIDGLLFPIGAITADDNLTIGSSEAEQIIKINLLAVVAVVARLLPRLWAQGKGVIVGFSSVAAIRGRSTNVVYSASKRALESYFESLRHGCASYGVTVVLYSLGYIDTNLSFGRALLAPTASPRSIARRVSRRFAGLQGKRYLPRSWRLIAFIIRMLPWCIFRRMRF